MPDSPPVPRPHPAARYVIALISIGLAIAVRAGLMPLFGGRFPFLTFLVAVSVAAWVGIILFGRLVMRRTTERATAVVLETTTHRKQLEQEIEERRRAVNALRESEVRFRALMEQSPQSTQVFAPDGRTIQVNRAWEELWGVTLDQIGDYNILCDPQLEAKGIRPYIHRAFAGEVVQIPVIEYNPDETIPGRTRHADARRWTRAVMYPLKDAEGHVREVVLIHEDITGQRRAEAALQDAQRFLERVAHISPAILLVYDIEHQRNIYANRDIGVELGYPPGESDGAGPAFLAKVFHPDDLSAAAQGKQRFLTLADGEVITSAYRMRHASGAWRWRSVRLTVFARHPDGRPRELLGVSQDVTDQKRAEEGLREADRRKDEFLATLAHELRNPLAPIRTGLKIMQLAGDNYAAVEQARAMMERQLQQMVRLIDDLLDVSRITRGKLELRKCRAELADVMQAAIEASRPLIEAAGVELTVALPAEPIYVDADVTRLAQVFTNLLNNAAKFTERGGHVWLTTDRNDSEVVVTIRDTGIGIPAEMLAKVFDLFAQVDRSLERSRGGLGIGLTLARRLIALHGGTVEAISAGPGQGTSFMVRLPQLLSEEEKRRKGEGETRAEGAPSSPALPSSVSNAKRLRILVADDNRDAADSLQMMLDILGHEVRATNDGPEAVRAAEEFRPDVAFLDIGMPGMNGYDVARAVRAQPWGRTMTLVALTGWGQDEDRRRSREAGFDQHLVKPVDPEVLQQTLARLV